MQLFGCVCLYSFINRRGKKSKKHIDIFLSIFLSLQYLIKLNILNNLKLDFTLNITLKIAVHNVYAKLLYHLKLLK